MTTVRGDAGWRLIFGGHQEPAVATLTRAVGASRAEHGRAAHELGQQFGARVRLVAQMVTYRLRRTHSTAPHGF